MSAPVDVLAVMDNAQALVFEPGRRGEEWATLIAEARAAVAELIEAAAVFEAQDRADGHMGSARLRVALARCKGAQA